MQNRWAATQISLTCNFPSTMSITSSSSHYLRRSGQCRSSWCCKIVLYCTVHCASHFLLFVLNSYKCWLKCQTESLSKPVSGCVLFCRLWWEAGDHCSSRPQPGWLEYRNIQHCMRLLKGNAPLTGQEWPVAVRAWEQPLDPEWREKGSSRAAFVLWAACSWSVLQQVHQAGSSSELTQGTGGKIQHFINKQVFDF